MADLLTCRFTIRFTRRLLFSGVSSDLEITDIVDELQMATTLELKTDVIFHSS